MNPEPIFTAILGGVSFRVIHKAYITHSFFGEDSSILGT